MDADHHQSFHPDEEVNYRVSRLIEPAQLKFTPGFYNYGTFYLTSLRVASDVAAVYTGGTQNELSDWAFIRKCEGAGRLISVFAGSMLCLVVFYTAKRFTTEVGAGAAGLMMAFAPALVVHSRFATVDMFALFWLTLAAHYAVKLACDADPKWVRWTILAAICAGFSAGTKYAGGLAIVMPLVALGLRRPAKWVGYSIWSLVVCLFAFLITTPGVFLDDSMGRGMFGVSNAFWRDFTAEQQHVATGHGMVFVGTSSGFAYHLSNLALGLGSFALVLGLVALGWAVCTRRHWAIVLLAFALLYYLLIGTQQVKFMRYCFPLMPALALGIGFAVGEGHERGGRWRLLTAVGILAVLGLDGGGLRGSVQFTESMLSKDNREVAADYIKGLSTDGTVAGLVSDPWFYTPTLYQDTAMVRYVPFAARMELMDDATRPKVAFYRPIGAEPVPWDSRLITETKPDYIVYSEYELEDIQRLSQMASVPAHWQPDVDRFNVFQKLLQANYSQTAVFGSGFEFVEDMRHVVPTIYVWKRKS
jgi:hypothetical protein